MRICVLLTVLVVAACSSSPSESPEPSSAAQQQVSAAASPTGTRYGARFTLCARGSYASYAVFRDKSRSQTVPPGQCTTKAFALEDGPHRAHLYGIDADLDRAFLIGTDWFGSDYDANLQTTGTPANPDWSEF
ncbi:hypothetical protein [Cryptosporangium japonicum]|uniref:Lipoprotein n=1 Tax=Cryptosporangium japonicum TaxID=80872 RepID=A0ABN0USY9_9ACTN